MTSPEPTFRTTLPTGEPETRSDREPVAATDVELQLRIEVQQAIMAEALRTFTKANVTLARLQGARSFLLGATQD